MLRLPPDYAQVLRDLPDTGDNALYWRERRRDARRGEPWRTLADTTAVLALVCLLAAAAQWGLASLAGGELPEWLGGQDGWRLVFIGLAYVHGMQIYYAARWRTSRLFGAEARGGTLFQILTTRVPAFEMVVQGMVYPFQQAMLVALAGLPLYLLMLGRGTIGVQELLATYAFWVWLALAPPAWRTPAFAERSPEEMAAAVRAQERTAGWTTVILGVVLVPGAMIVGTFAWAFHTYAARGVATWVPREVWAMLPAVPITAPWVVVRLLAAPLTWFGVPLPLWAWLLPLMVLGRLGAAWMTSLYLRVADLTQLWMLPDMLAMRTWRVGMVRLWLLAIAGYLWQPILTIGLFRLLIAPVSAGAGTDLAGLVLLLLAGGLPFTLLRARRWALQRGQRPDPLSAVARSVAVPLAPAVVAIALGCVTVPGSFLTFTAWSVVGPALGVCAAAVVLALSMGRGTRYVWWALLAAGVVAPFFHLRAISALGGLNPWVALFGLSPTAAPVLATSVIPYVCPPWWAGILLPLALAGAARLADSAGVLHRYDRSGERAPRVVRLRPAANAGNGAGAHHPAPEPTIVGVSTALEPTVEFRPATSSDPPLVAAPTVTAAQSDVPVPAPGGGLPAVEAPPVIAPPPLFVPVPGYTPPAAPVSAPPPVVLAPTLLSAPAAGPSAAQAWRYRPLSPLGAGVLRWLMRVTDNPVALYSARRELPGTLGSDGMKVGLVFLVLFMVVAALAPTVTSLFGAFGVQAALFPRPFIDSTADGFAGLISWMVLVSMLYALPVCKRVANAYRRERESASLGFILATPLSSTNVAIGHCVGAATPTLAAWAATALLALSPAIVLATLGWPLYALWGWAVGFGCSLLFLAMSVVTGAWIGLTEAKPRDITVGVWVLPAAFCTLWLCLAVYLGLSRQWPYAACMAVYIAGTAAFVAFLWRSTVRDLWRIRHGDLPFEGRTTSA